MTLNIESYDSEPLTCDAFEERVHLILDDRLTLTGDARLMEHAAQCSDCETMLLEYDSLDDAISFLKQSTRDVVSTVECDSADGLPFRPLAALTVLAAMLLICLNFSDGLSLERSGGLAQRAEIETTALTPRSHPTPSSSSRGHLAIAHPGTAQGMQPVSRFENRVTPVTSPFSPNFRVADNIPRLPSAPNWERVAKPFETWEPVITYSAELPGIKTIQCTLNVTLELLRRSLS